MSVVIRVPGETSNGGWQAACTECGWRGNEVPWTVVGDYAEGTIERAVQIVGGVVWAHLEGAEHERTCVRP